MSFNALLIAAKNNEPEAKVKIFDMYNPLLIKESLIRGVFDEDLYQELHRVMLQAIKTFAA